tara:strand:+ start:9046 stop:9963 length:918 start_codon:yes stop_codon:yes gene_type:complete
MKIYLNKPNEDWIVDRFWEEWHQHNQDISTKNINKADIVWIISPWTWKKIKKKSLKHKIVVCTIHHIDFEKFKGSEKRNFFKRDKYIDSYHAISDNTKKQLQSLTNKPITTIPFWINDKLFFEIKDKNILREKYSISKKEYLIGSFQRDTEGVDLISPKLSKGPDQFIKMVEKYFKTHKDLAVVLTGKRRQYIINELKRLNIKYYYFEMTTYKELNELYNVLDLYIVASRVEGGPQSIFECAITKTPIVSTDVGIAKEILAKESLYDFNENFDPKPNTVVAYDNIKKFIIPDWFRDFYNMFESLM